jgi:hypothetical protein
MPQKGGSRGISSDTSSFMHQKGGSSSVYSNNKSNNDINQLISMLTSESEDTKKFNTNSTSTEELENKLRNMLQEGGNGKQSSVSFKTPLTNFNSLKNNLKNQSKYNKEYNITNDESTEELKKQLNNILSETTSEYKK